MKATDLRVNNLLYFKNTKDIAKVSLIHDKHFDCRDEYGSFIPNGNYEPIELTEEWLLKMGFEKDGKYYSKGYFHYHEFGHVFIGNDHVSCGMWMLVLNIFMSCKICIMI